MRRSLFALALLAFVGMANAATLYLTEFKDIPPVTFQAAPSPPVAQSVVAITAGSVQSALFNDATILIRVHCDVICNVNIGTNPTATTSTMRFIAGQTEYFRVQAGMRLAVIAGS